MERGRRISRILMAVTGGILILYMGVTAPGENGFSFSGVVITHFNKWVLAHVEKYYLTGFSYVPEEHAVSPGEWVAEKAMSLIPLAGYVEGRAYLDISIEDRETYEMLLARQERDENEVDENGELVGDTAEEAAVPATAAAIDTSLEKLQNYEYLVSNFYTVDSTTMTSAEELDAQKLLSKDMTLQGEEDGPKILIYHTHSQEAFLDSEAGNTQDSIVGMGGLLAELLNEKGIEAVHHTGVYDVIDGQLDRSRAYELAEPEITRILAENPSIEVVIDLHRDGVADTTRLVTEIDGKQTAQIMFFNGLSRTKANGEIAYLENPNREDNLAFSLQMQLAAAELYPGFTRRIYLKGYQYNMHLMPKYLLVEAGAQTNTVEEMRNAMEPLAEILYHVLEP